MFNFNNSYEGLPPAFYEKVQPTPVANPSFFITNTNLASDLGLEPEIFKDEGLAYLSGNAHPKDASLIAMAYMGHQFGYPAMLGDGRAILLGEHIAPTGERYDIQLKGAGRTSFSRGGDGRAALGPMIREYLISESLHALGVPTTRSLAVVKTGQDVLRRRTEDGAILTRVAKSHLRVGTFEWAKETQNDVEYLLNYAISRHDKDLSEREDKVFLWLKRVAERQGTLIAKWMSLGFVHGVMNTDNMTISGEGIDYGPCAFLDTFNPKAAFSSIDHFGRYRFDNQGQIAVFNLEKLAESIFELLDADPNQAAEKKRAALAHYAKAFETNYLQFLGEKLGFLKPSKKRDSYITECLNLMAKEKLDYTESFLRLTYGDKRELNSSNFNDFYRRLKEETKDSGEALRYAKNPAIIPKNYLVERAIQEAEAGDTRFLSTLLEQLKTPFAHSEAQKAYRNTPVIEGYQTFCGT